MLLRFHLRRRLPSCLPRWYHGEIKWIARLKHALAAGWRRPGYFFHRGYAQSARSIRVAQNLLYTCRAKLDGGRGNTEPVGDLNSRYFADTNFYKRHVMNGVLQVISEFTIVIGLKPDQPLTV